MDVADDGVVPVIQQDAASPALQHFVFVSVTTLGILVCVSVS